MPTNTATLTLAKIGNFVGLKVKELLALISVKANQADVDALPRFREARSEAEMLALQDLRPGDFCLRLDTKGGWRLRELPSTVILNWYQVFTGGSVNMSRSIQFSSNIAPIIQHDVPLPIVSVLVIDTLGRLNYVDYTLINEMSIRINFTEAVAGTCNITFQS